MSALSRRHVFVCGLHRSGTSMIARSLAGHSLVSGFRNTGAIEDEGQFLQTVFPVESAFGGVGRFGFDPRAHMTETSEFNHDGAARTLQSEWEPFWDLSKPVLLEKTPGNLLRMRLLARLFDDSRFIVVIRHPIAACLATMKWTEGNLFSLIAHWVHCYRIAKADSDMLGRTMWMSYESFVRNPVLELSRASEHLGLPPETIEVGGIRNDNEKYFEEWRRRILGDTGRAIEQLAPERPRGIFKRMADRLAGERKERAQPLHRRKENRRTFYDALDAVSFFEPAIQEFGYSFADLTQAPDFSKNREP